MISMKKELRSHFTSVRRAAKNEHKDNMIMAGLLRLSEIYDADNVLLYASYGSEVDTWDIAQELLERDIRIAYPKCSKDGSMTFHVVSDLSQLKKGLFGICEPDGSLPSPDITDKTVCVVPGLAFSLSGERLGYGGGFYDRFLERYPDIITIGLAYEATTAMKLPSEKHDIAVKFVITEERTVLCNE